MNVYEIGSMAEKLSTNPYPGRGIVLGVTPDGTKAVAAYFIMGRSTNSRNRVFIEEADGIRTEAHDPSLMSDPHLIIYHPVREIGQGLIVTNGDQTDTIWNFLARGESWEAALRTRQFEDDKPNWTPRISGLQAMDGSYKLSILKAAAPEGSAEYAADDEYDERALHAQQVQGHQGDDVRQAQLDAGERNRHLQGDEAFEPGERKGERYQQGALGEAFGSVHAATPR